MRFELHPKMGRLRGRGKHTCLHILSIQGVDGVEISVLCEANPFRHASVDLKRDFIERDRIVKEVGTVLTSDLTAQARSGVS